MLQRLSQVGLVLLGTTLPACAEASVSNQSSLDRVRSGVLRGESMRLAQSEDQRPRGREYVGTPRYEPRAGWISLASRSIVHGTGEGQFTVNIGKRQVRSLHLVSDGNSVVIRAVRVKGGRILTTKSHNLYTGSSYDIDLAGQRGASTIEIDFTARADGSRAPAVLTVYASP